MARLKGYRYPDTKLLTTLVFRALKAGRFEYEHIEDLCVEFSHTLQRQISVRMVKYIIHSNGLSVGKLRRARVENHIVTILQTFDGQVSTRYIYEELRDEGETTTYPNCCMLVKHLRKRFSIYRGKFSKESLVLIAAYKTAVIALGDEKITHKAVAHEMKKEIAAFISRYTYNQIRLAIKGGA